ncbi:MAG: hypothetical protein IPJ11_14015 [Gemmatimonadetes bacterium]|nr:hypothetical protein [Gemmatimonadota bacterium]
MRRTIFLLCVLWPTTVGAQGRQSPLNQRPRAVSINAEFLRLASLTALWPGYRPEGIPLAVFTGDHTYLFRHPSPPPEFTTVDGVASMPGRHPAVTANSSATIGGIGTATLLADGVRGALPVTDQAAVALHEAFHVFQRTVHSSWAGNEGDLFTYPVERPDLLRLRREESEYLRRALAAAASAKRCLTRMAMMRRAERFTAMDAAHVAYERNSEMNEGLATYVQLRAVAKRSVEIPMGDFPTTAVRRRVYATGPALAFLLDAARPGWREELERNDSLRLDPMLAQAVADAPGRCDLPAGVTARMARTATADVRRLAAERISARLAFDRLAGWRLVIEPAIGAPLWPQGFDPLNIAQVAGGTLHHRMLKLGNDSLSISMVDGEGVDFEALTEAAGAHPLFNGIRRAEFVLPSQPMITREGSVVTISAPGLQGRFAGMEVMEAPNRIVVRIRR